MANSLPWSVKGVDPRTRDAAKAAARRAGMTLGAWLDHKIRDAHEDAFEAEAPAAPPEQLDIAALSERLAQLSQGKTDTAPRIVRQTPSRSEIDALVRQAATAEKLTRETSARTAGALDSIARWIEQTEDRLASGERAAAERQERATSVIAEAIKTMGERIVEIERRAGETRQPAAGERSPRLAFSRDGLAAAVTDIRSRQRLLDRDEDEPAPTEPSSQERISALRADLRELGARLSPEARRGAAQQRPAAPFAAERAASLESKIAALGERLDKLSGRDHFEPILKPLARLEAEVSRLSRDRAQGDHPRLQHDIAELAARVDALASGGAGVDLAPLARDMAELRGLFAQKDGDHRLEELSQQIAMLGFEIGRLRETQPDMREMRSLSAAIDDIRGSLLSSRPRDFEAAPLAALAEQIDRLSQKFDEVATQRPADQLDRRIDLLQQHVEQLAAQSPAAVIRQIETLAERIESIAASSEFARMAETREASADLRPIEDMLRHLADKIDEAGTPGANSDSFEALEQQIAGIAARLDEAAATRSAESGLERTLQDLVVHLRSMRDETAAERAALAQGKGSPAPGKGITELSSLVSGLRDTQISSERQTQDALGALNQTLEAIMGRLANLEGELLGERKPAAGRSATARTLEAAMRPEPAQSTAAQPREPDLAMPGPGGAARRTEPSLALPASAFDLPLEPGSGRPRPEAAAPSPDAQSVRQSLIAAARRSAKAASEAAAAPAPTAEPAAKSPNRLREIMEKRKRPLLLGLAALILALGTAQVVTTTLRKDTRTVSNQSRGLAAPAATPSEAPAPAPAEPVPAKDRSSAASPASGSAPSGTATAGNGEAASFATPSTAANLPSLEAPQAAPETATAPEPVQPVTGLGELPAGLGSAGLRKAALDGDARAVYELASRAADGPVGSRDPKLALRLFERAAVAGLAPAQFRLGNMFEKGVGAPRDIALARIWYQRAAERGNAKAMHNLAVLSAEGAAGKPDYATATAWFAKAAELGVRDSQYNLAVLLGRGLGAPTDLAQSYVWFTVAAGQGDEDAARKRDEVAQRLKPDELAAAKARAAEWKPKPLDAAANEVAPPPKGWDAGPTAAAAKPGKPSRS
ncbi:hypothetical protein [Bosea minatitlanensis]|uniref:hypothetical protein n=1 Tax=Bosea minatitlanensis TaxID=128782 RepID=UPI0021A33D6D|nr:hypothetical protein [Bosea minatitlanensis]MCT4493175.1 hypothetical protein [Bosea minatitlanensis]